MLDWMMIDEYLQAVQLRFKRERNYVALGVIVYLRNELEEKLEHEQYDFERVMKPIFDALNTRNN